MSYATARRRGANAEINKLYAEDRAVHEWYRFVLSFPPHLVRAYLERFGLAAGHRVLDPFCGTGTTLVECKKHGIPSIGIEANPGPAPHPLRSLPSDQASLLLRDSISPLPLHKTLVLLERLRCAADPRWIRHEADPHRPTAGRHRRIPRL